MPFNVEQINSIQSVIKNLQKPYMIVACKPSEENKEIIREEWNGRIDFHLTRGAKGIEKLKHRIHEVDNAQETDFATEWHYDAKT